LQCFGKKCQDQRRFLAWGGLIEVLLERADLIFMRQSFINPVKTGKNRDLIDIHHRLLKKEKLKGK
jgi:hypothetical protein